MRAKRRSGCTWPAGRSPGTLSPDRLPLEDFPAPADGHPVLGVVHCDLDATRSAYAPVSRAALQRTGAAGWFLGHIHKPSLTQEPHPIGYLGSLVGLDPTETGPRGPWWVEVTPDRDVRLTHLPLAPLRWDAFEMAMDPHLAPEDVFDRVRQAAQDHHDRLEKTELAHVRVLGLRLRVTGTVDRPGRLAREWPASGQIMTLGERLAFFDRIQDDTRPAVDLEELAASQGPPRTPGPRSAGPGIRPRTCPGPDQHGPGPHANPGAGHALCATP